jgi:nucleotide-binding universal stress UspA family protein
MKVLLAIDGSKCSEAAVETLIREYKPTGTEVLVLHVLDSLKLTPISYSCGIGPMFLQNFNKMAQQWRKNSEELVSRATGRLQAAGFKTSAQVEEGDAREKILECARKWNPDLILLGSHGKKGLDYFTLGSVSEAVARRAECSVQIVRASVSAA